ncbi:hypothetical protein ACFLWR_00495 [Chloroflexota bacterium]
MLSKVKRFIIAPVLVAALVTGSTAGMTLAAEGVDEATNNAPRIAFQEGVAEILGITLEDLQSTVTEAWNSVQDIEDPHARRDAFHEALNAILIDQHGIEDGAWEDAIEAVKTANQEQREALRAEQEAQREAFRAEQEAQREAFRTEQEAQREAFRAEQEAQREALRAERGVQGETPRAEKKEQREALRAEKKEQREALRAEKKEQRETRKVERRGQRAERQEQRQGNHPNTGTGNTDDTDNTL